MSDRICPYPGLRPFVEDEAIFFQGREENVDTISSVLEQNHFLMLAGSSGDGKSSLVFAGLIPHCRAGFFRAAYPSWAVAIFRPERSPLQQLAKALAEVLYLEPGPVEGTLRHGFSALVDLYMSSSAIGGVNDDASDKSRLASSQNLLIVADQFEELFTNPENFVAGAPSSEARLCVNLLLETARLALTHDLPIYVVCTMRSDYIGQCNAFSGLPEMIGFSHYFVPRLTRAQLRRVVLDPARLNGDQIAPRLAERLIYDLSEGEDQLPLLQHTLASIWRQADEDETAMDLQAYSRCGGMPENELPAEAGQATPLQNETETDETISYGLGAVLNQHAGDLFRQAMAAEPAPRADWYLARAFTCLTGQDNGRMVRNRMTIGQIARTIEENEAEWPALEAALVRMFAPFRSMAAGFVRPLLHEGESEELAADAVLDITHEALIRNWDSLREWTQAEHRRLRTWRELEPQVLRWAQARDGHFSDKVKKPKIALGTLLDRKGSTYLLPIGPLNYFESWQAETRPTAFWMARYASPEATDTDRQSEGEKLNRQTGDFLRRSAMNLAATRFVTRVGAWRIISTVLLFCLGISLVVGIWRHYQSSNEQVVNRAQARAEKIFFDPLADRETKKTYLLNTYAGMLKAGSTPEQAFAAVRSLIAREANDSLKTAAALDGSAQFLRFFTSYVPPCVRGLLGYADSVVAAQKPIEASRNWVFLASVRLHGFWKGLYFLSARPQDSQQASLALGRVRKELPNFLSSETRIQPKALATAIVYDAFYDLSDQKRIGQWLDQVEGATLPTASRADSAVYTLFNPSEQDLDNETIIRCGKFLCNRLDYFTGIERTYVVGKRMNMEAIFDPIKFYLCQTGAQSATAQKFEQEMLGNLQKSGVTATELSQEIYPVMLMAGNPIQLVAPGSLPTHAFWGDLFTDPGQVLNASLLTSGTYKNFLLNTELLLNNTVGKLCPAGQGAQCELAMGKFLFEYAAPYSLPLAKRFLVEGAHSLPANMPTPERALALTDSAVSLVYLPAYHAILNSSFQGLHLASDVNILEPVDPVTIVTCLNRADQRLLDSLTTGLEYNTFANPIALWVARWANPQTRVQLQEGLRGASPEVMEKLIAYARQSLLVTDLTLLPARTRKDSLNQVADMYAIQRLLAHQGAELPRYESPLVVAGDFGKASGALATYMVINEENFSKTARKAVSLRQIEDENTGALRLHMVDMYSLSGQYWPAFRELENIYSVKNELYLINNLLFDHLNLRHETGPELAFYYRRYLLGVTSVGQYR